MSEIHTIPIREIPCPPRSRARKAAVAFGVAVSVAVTVAGAGYAGIVIGYKNDVLTAEEQRKAYDDAIRGMSPAGRYAAEFITGVNVCNPEDSNNFFQTIGAFQSVEACGRAESSSFPEPDESLGSVCLANTVYDPAVGGMITLKSLTDISIEPTGGDKPSLSFTVSPKTVTVADQQTDQILRSYNCPVPAQ